MCKHLPRTESLPVDKLAGALTDTTASYKHLFFRSLLSILKRRYETGDENRTISFLELEAEMLWGAFHTVVYYKLDLGEYDQIKNLFGMVGFFEDESRKKALLNQSEEQEKQLRKTLEKIDNALSKQPSSKESMDQLRINFEEVLSSFSQSNKEVRNLKKTLLRYVPYKMLSPWVRDGFNLNSRQSNVGKLHRITTSNTSRKFLYSTSGPDTSYDQKSIKVHPQWNRYLIHNIAIVEGWANSKWLNYLQGRNPNVPSLAAKLWAPPIQRHSLDRQRKLWSEILGTQRRFRCIYTDSLVPKKEFVLDHFLPFSWVGHNQLWNLLPTSRSVNSSKGQLLPLKSHVEKFSKVQQSAIKTIKNLHSDHWKKRVEDYTVGLDLEAEDLLNQDKLHSTYQDIFSSQLQLAQNKGFHELQGQQFSRRAQKTRCRFPDRPL